MKWFDDVIAIFLISIQLSLLSIFQFLMINYKMTEFENGFVCNHSLNQDCANLCKMIWCYSYLFNISLYSLFYFPISNNKFQNDWIWKWLGLWMFLQDCLDFCKITWRFHIPLSLQLFLLPIYNYSEYNFTSLPSRFSECMYQTRLSQTVTSTVILMLTPPHPSATITPWYMSNVFYPIRNNTRCRMP